MIKESSMAKEKMMSDSNLPKSYTDNVLLDIPQEKFSENIYVGQEQAFLPGITPPINDASVVMTVGGSGGDNDGGGIPPTMPDNDDYEEKPQGMSLLEHLSELRKRLTKCIIVIGIAFFACYSISDTLFHYLALPLINVMPVDTKLIFTSVPEGFFVYLKVAFVAALFVTSPYIFYQIWLFISPGLYDEEKKYILPLAICSASFFLGGAAFCYFIVFPFVFVFFMSYSTATIVAMPSLSNYLSFSLKLLVAFGLIFEMPLFAFFLGRMNVITAEKMRSVRKYAILVVFIVAAILTPPDVFSQILMAIPMLILYELSILVVALSTRHREKEKTTK